MRIQRHKRIRAKISGTAERPRVAVFRSNRSLFIQAIDDTVGKTIASATSGLEIAKKMSAAGIKSAVFDRGGYKYHGRVRQVAEEIRSGGITI